MTTLQLIGARLLLCLPKLNHYGLYVSLAALFVLTTALRPTEFSNDNPTTEKFVKTETAAMMPQFIYIPETNVVDTVLIVDCDEQVSFESDQSEGVLYKDSTARNSVVVICPPDSSRYLKASFSDFDLEEGDTLYAYAGMDTMGTFLAKGSGRGNFQMNGGWVGSICDKGLETTGCITFQFKTDGDNAKGAGWEAWVTCENGTTAITPPDHQFITLKCDELKKTVTVTAGDIVSDCALMNDSVLVQIFNTKGTLCMDTCLRENASFTIDTLAIGRYTIQHSLKKSPSVTAKSYVVLSPPALTCNDEVKAVFGTSCIASIREDDVLENPCDTSENLYYNIIIMGPNGDTIKTGTSRNKQYPVVTKDDVELCSGAKYRVEVTRIYDYQNGCCSEGLIKDVCWSYVEFLDGSKPSFTSHHTDTLMACGQINFAEIAQHVSKPNIIDNCDSVTLDITDYKLVSGNECSEMRIYAVTWEAKDLCGNKATQVDTLHVVRPNLKEVIKLPNVTLSCGEDNPETMEDYERLGIIKIPMPGDTITLSTEYYTCNYILTKKDEIVPHPGGKKVARYWSVIDGCGNIPYPIQIDTQIIEFIDTLAPTIDCSPYHTLETAQSIALPANDCAMEVSLPKPTASDICAEPIVSMFSVEQLKDGEWERIASNLSEAGELYCDTFRVHWEAKDASLGSRELADTCIQYFRLEDKTPPRVICQDEVQLSYEFTGTRLYATEVDNQTTDACGIAKIEIRKEGQDWGEYVEFFCEDVHKTFPASLRFTDKNGNTNTCDFNVILLDNIPPYCADLADFTGTCDEYHNNQLGESTDSNENGLMDEAEWTDLTGYLLEEYNRKFGTPQCEDNLACVPFTSEQQYQLIYEQCGVITARRRYRITDWNGQGISSSWRYQNINITYQPNWSFTLPIDFYGECGDNHPEPSITINNGACDLIAWEHEDQVFDIIPDACYKVIRTYHIINWCNYVQGQEPIEISRNENIFGLVNEEKTVNYSDVSNYGYFTYVQVLKVTDNEAPTITINDVPSCIYGVGDAAPAGVEDQTPGFEPYECDTIRIFSAEASDCEQSVFKNFSFTYEIFEDGTSVATGEGSKFFWTVRPKVKYTVHFTVYDNCGNEATATKEFEFWDCARPTVACITDSSVEITEDSVARIDAYLLNKGSFDNCTPQSQLRFRLWHESVSPTPPTDKAGVVSLPTLLYLDCNYQGTQPLYFYALDEENNYDLCITSVEVYNSSGICPAMSQAFIAGNIHTMNNKMVEEVEIAVTGSTNMPSAYTSENGDFSFNLARGQSYQVSPTKNDNPLNGVSTFDLILISKHILGIENFENPYQYIAADVNNSGTVTAFDLVQLRQLILNITTSFQNNTSWRFIDANYEFTTNTPLTEHFKEVITIDNHQNDEMHVDFVAVKIGDLNYSATTNSLHVGASRTARPTMNLTIQDSDVQVGDYVTVDFNLAQVSELQGLQMALQFTDLELVDIKEGLVQAQHIGENLLDKGILLTSWDKWNSDATTHPDQTNLFTLEFKALKTGKLNEFLHLQPKILQTETYHATGEIFDLDLQFNRTHSTVTLEQNRPNPFKTSTSIGFQLPKAGKATLTILDVQGRVLLQQTRDFSAGYQQWIIDGQSLPAKGILYYQLATDREVFTKKMMKIE